MCESIITTYIIQTFSVDDAMEHYKEINEQLTWETWGFLNASE
jgi:hypothetical protein